MNLKGTINLSLILICLFSFNACLGKKSLIGKWQNIDSEETTEFFKDGTVAMQSGDRFMTGKFSVIDDSRFKMEFSSGLAALAGPVIVKYEFAGSQLTLTLPNNQSMQLRRTD